MYDVETKPAFGPQPHLYFMHIPKTAGTSLRYWMQDLYPSSSWLPCHILDELDRFTPQQAAQYQLWSGHFGWKIFERFGQVRPTITWLRDPVRREISNYQFVRQRRDELIQIARENQREDWVDYYLQTLGLPLPELCQSSLYLGFSDNLQTRYLSGIFPSSDAITVDETTLRQAESNLERLFYFGICEWMPCSIDLLSHQLASPRRLLANNLNQSTGGDSSGRLQLSDSETQLIREVNRYDQSLYEFGRRLFTSRCKAFLSQFDLPSHGVTPAEWPPADRAADFESALSRALLANFQNHQPIVPTVEAATFRFSDALIQSGWHRRIESESGACIRWAGPENCSSIYLPIKPGPAYRLRFQLHYAARRDLLESLTLSVGPFPLPMEITPYDPAAPAHRRQVTAFIPASAVSSAGQYTEIRFQTVGDLVPVSSDDACRVSFATDGFEIDTVAEQSLPTSWPSAGDRAA